MIYWKQETAYVLGGAGMIGSRLCEELERRGLRNLHVIDNLSRGSIDNLRGLRNFTLDETNLETTVPKIKPDSIVFALAAIVTGIQYNAGHSHTMAYRNSLINLHTAEGVVRAKPKMFFYTSTACIYSHDAPVPTPESCGDVYDPEPTNKGYSQAKWMGEKHAQLIAEQYGTPAIVSRFFNATDPTRDYHDPETSHVLPALIYRVLSGENPLEVWGSGRQSRVLVASTDIAHCIVDLVERHHDNPDVNWGRPVNIGHSHQITIGDLARLVTEACGVPDLPIVFRTDRPNGYEARAADPTLLNSLIGEHDFKPIEEIVTEMVAGYRQRYGVHSLDRATA